jgi:GLPGLI family protein
VIAGYKCKKAQVTLKEKDGNGKTINVFYTDEIPTNEIKPVYKGLKGFPLEYSVNQGGVEMKLTAKSISKTTVSDSKFEIPKEGYTITTVEGLQKAMTKEMGPK